MSKKLYYSNRKSFLIFYYYNIEVHVIGITKKIKNNKIYIAIFIFCLIMMLLLIANETNIFYIIKEYIFNSNYRDNYINNSDIPINFDVNLLNIIKYELTNYNRTYDSMLIWGTNIFQLIIPVFVSISALIFYNKNQSINKLVINKEKKYKQFLFKESISNSAKISISIFLSYIMIYILSIIISKGTINEGINRYFMLDIVGEDFYYRNTQIYYLLDGIIRLFFIPLIYSFFACSVSLLCKNYKQVFLVPIICYFGITYSSLAIRNISSIGIYINQSLVMTPNSYSNLNSYLIFIMPLIAILISLIIIFWRNKHVEILKNFYNIICVCNCNNAINNIHEY